MITNQDCNAEAEFLHDRLVLTCSKILKGSWVSIHTYNIRNKDSGTTTQAIGATEYNTTPKIDHITDLMDTEVTHLKADIYSYIHCIAAINIQNDPYSRLQKLVQSYITQT